MWKVVEKDCTKWNIFDRDSIRWHVKDSTTIQYDTLRYAFNIFTTPDTIASGGKNIAFTWDASPQLDVDGYEMHLKITGANDSLYLDIGNKTRWEVILKDIGLYDFRVCVYDTAGNDSCTKIFQYNCIEE